MDRKIFIFVIKKFEEIISFSLLVILIGVMTFQVACRYVFNSPFSWPEELSGYLLVWLSMFGAVVGIKNKAHTMIEFIINRVPKKIRLAFNVISFLLISVLLWVLIITGFIVAQKTSFPTATLPFTWTVVYLAVPIGSFLMFIRLVEDAIVRICRNRQSNIIS